MDREEMPAQRRKPKKMLSWAEKQERQKAKIERKTPEQLEAYAYNLAIWYLTQKGYSRYELSGKLIKKQLPTDLADATCDKLESQGILNDKDYAESLVRYYHGVKRWSEKRILSELNRKGIDSDLASEIVEEQRDEEADWENALVLARKKARATRREPDARKRRQKVINAVSTRGHSYDLAARAADEALAEES